MSCLILNTPGAYTKLRLPLTAWFNTWFNTFGEMCVNVKFTHPNSRMDSR